MQENEPTPIDPESINPGGLTLLGQGRTAEVYVLREQFVLKLFRPNFPKVAIENEYLICRSIGSVIDIPRAHQLLTIAGRDAIIFDLVKGISGFKYLLRNPWSIESFAKEFAGIQAKIHSMTAPEETPELKTILTRNVNLHDLLSATAKARILENISTLPDGRALCHGDFHPDNLLISKGKSFVLDWMTATKGNPLADVARTSVLLKWAEPGPGAPPMVKVFLQGLRRRFHRQYLSEYLRLTGAHEEAVAKWELPVMAARLMEWLPESELQVLVTNIHDKLNRL
jgi:aminoglycoside phosphotransferase (APT) family kinase protein